jgi:hypothetical protein
MSTLQQVAPSPESGSEFVANTMAEPSDGIAAAEAAPTSDLGCVLSAPSPTSAQSLDLYRTKPEQRNDIAKRFSNRWVPPFFPHDTEG